MVPNLNNVDSNTLRHLLTQRPGKVNPEDQIRGLNILYNMRNTEWTPTPPSVWASLITTPTYFEALQNLGYKLFGPQEPDYDDIDKLWFNYTQAVVEFSTFRENLRTFGLPAVHRAAINIFLSCLWALAGSLNWRYRRLAILCDAIGLEEILPVSLDKGTQILAKHWDQLVCDFVTEIEVYFWDEAYGTLYVRNTLSINDLPADIAEEEEDEPPL